MKIVAIEIVCFYTMYFIFIFALFGYFGEGAGASSPEAVLSGKIAEYILVLSPLLFNGYKVFTLYKNQRKVSLTYLIAEVIMILFIIYSYYSGFIGS